MARANPRTVTSLRQGAVTAEALHAVKMSQKTKPKTKTARLSVPAAPRPIVFLNLALLWFIAGGVFWHFASGWNSQMLILATAMIVLSAVSMFLKAVSAQQRRRLLYFDDGTLLLNTSQNVRLIYKVGDVSSIKNTNQVCRIFFSDGRGFAFSTKTTVGAELRNILAKPR
jgi:hypothetical protein